MTNQNHERELHARQKVDAFGFATCELCKARFKWWEAMAHICDTTNAAPMPDCEPGVKLNEWWEVAFVLVNGSIQKMLIEGEYVAKAIARNAMFNFDKEPMLMANGFRATPLIVPAQLVLRKRDIVSAMSNRAPHNVFVVTTDVEIPDADSLTYDIGAKDHERREEANEEEVQQDDDRRADSLVGSDLRGHSAYDRR